MAQVEIYSTPSCGYCKQAKDFFEEKGIDYADYDVSVDQEKRAEMIEMTGQMGVPVIVVKGHDPVIGYNRAVVAEMLEIEEQ